LPQKEFWISSDLEFDLKTAESDHQGKSPQHCSHFKQFKRLQIETFWLQIYHKSIKRLCRELFDSQTLFILCDFFFINVKAFLITKR